ncbi:hypothetical protein SASPL_109665 [Salvia splendens]|uniref:Uncharacterized protein n=1 Tax=Salvia splendens TaxID=180675 RepID=A0A8X8YFJ4_SALSN|nr:hypothetical protein SASPL_109665 [Salvia splendens]
MGGGMETNKNRWIEDWATNRENLEHHFRWTRRNLALVGIFGVAVPILVYKGVVKEFELVGNITPFIVFGSWTSCPFTSEGVHWTLSVVLLEGYFS